MFLSLTFHLFYLIDCSSQPNVILWPLPGCPDKIRASLMGILIRRPGIEWSWTRSNPWQESLSSAGNCRLQNYNNCFSEIQKANCIIFWTEANCPWSKNDIRFPAAVNYQVAKLCDCRYCLWFLQKSTFQPENCSSFTLGYTKSIDRYEHNIV